MEDNLEHNDIHSENLTVQTKITLILILEAKYNERKNLIENMQKKRKTLNRYDSEEFLPGEPWGNSVFCSSCDQLYTH